MQISVSEILEADVGALNDGHLVALRGELDLASQEALVALLGGLSGGFVVVDLAALSFADAAGVQTLLSARQFAASRGQHLSIVGAVGLTSWVLDLLDRSRAHAAEATVGLRGG